MEKNIQQWFYRGNNKNPGGVFTNAGKIIGSEFSKYKNAPKAKDNTIKRPSSESLINPKNLGLSQTITISITPMSFEKTKINEFKTFSNEISPLVRPKRSRRLSLVNEMYEMHDSIDADNILRAQLNEKDKTIKHYKEKINKIKEMLNQMYNIILKLNEGEKSLILCLKSKKKLIQQASENYSVKSRAAQKLLTQITSKNVESLYKTFTFSNELETLPKENFSHLKNYAFDAEESTETIKSFKENLSEKDKIIESYKMKNNKIENMLYEMSSAISKLKEKKNSLALDAELSKYSLQQIMELKEKIIH